MNAERRRKIEDIYHTALDIKTLKRKSFLFEICGDDRELRQEVESLLGYAEVSSNLLDQLPTDVAAEMLSDNGNSEFIGKEIKHYKIVSQIGVGGMGEVFLAIDTKLERNVAIKFIKTEFVEDKDKLRRFEQEAKTASSLNHPNILTVYEIEKSKNHQFIATEYIEGKTLRTRMNEKTLSLNKILDIAIQVATALHAAHSAGIIHRDIKPENIMLRRDGLVKVLDFGLAKLVGIQKEDLGPENGEYVTAIQTPLVNPKSKVQNRKLTNSSMLMGTAAYISPEQARLELIDARSDLWSLSIVLFEMLTGDQPFEGHSTGETIESILKDEPILSADNIPVELKRIILKGLRKNSEDRYQTASDLLGDLRNCQKDVVVESEFTQDSGYLNDNHKTSVNENRDSASVGGNTNDLFEVRSNNDSSAEFIFKKAAGNKVFSVGLLASILVAIAFIGYFNFSGEIQPSKSLVVIPFSSGDTNFEYLADGISQSLIDSLSELNGVKVAAQTSALKYKGKEAELEKNARDLGVQYFLRGKITQLADNFQVFVELVDVQNNSQFWNEQFQFKSTDVADIESQITKQIIEHLNIQLTGNEQQQVKKMKPDPQAYELFLKGRFFNSQGTIEGVKKAIEYYKQAIEIDPNFAEAYAALGSNYFFIGANGIEEPKEAMRKARAAAEKALELNETLAESHIAMATIHRADWNWSGAESEYKRAIELNPNLASAHFGYAYYLSTVGRNAEAISEIKKSRDLDPLKPLIYNSIGNVYSFAREYDLALEQFKIAEELDPNPRNVYYDRAFNKAVRGQYDEAIIDYKESIRNGTHGSGEYCYFGFALAKAGRTDEARAVLKKLETGKEYVSPVELSIIYIGLGEKDKAVSKLEQGYAEHDSQMQYLLVEPHFDGLRTDVRFQDLLRRVGLVPIS